MCSHGNAASSQHFLTGLKPQGVPEALEMAGEGELGLLNQQFSAQLCGQAGMDRSWRSRGRLSQGEGHGCDPSPPLPPQFQQVAEPCPGLVLGAELLPTVCALSFPDEDLIRQILADGASGISQDLGPYMRAETDLISGL